MASMASEAISPFSTSSDSIALVRSAARDSGAP